MKARSQINQGDHFGFRSKSNRAGIEFDYCCVHGVQAVQEAGYEAIMVNCNPETVSTDFDLADKLYFEPIYWEHLREIIDLENLTASLFNLVVKRR